MVAAVTATGVATILTPIGVIVAAFFGRKKLNATAASVNEIHVLVNSRMTEALARIQSLETKLGLAPGEAVPSARIVTTPTPTVEPTPGPTP